jgi:2-hydroxy-6-oxonona-2,4-dienedioate hydrolase
LEPIRLKSQWTPTSFGVIHSRTGVTEPEAHAAVVVLVHGMVVSSTYMVPLAERLATLCRVHAVDLPGFGKSDKPDRKLMLPQLADSLADWMDARDIPKAHFIGNSFGCQILAEFALRHQHRVHRLVLQGPTVDPAARTFPKQLVRFLINSHYDSSYGSSSLGWIMIKDYTSAGVRRFLEVLKIVFEDKIEEKLPLISAPTLVVRGSNDPLVPALWAEQATRLLPNGELKVIPGGAHTLNFTAPLELVRVIRPFLQV